MHEWPILLGLSLGKSSYSDYYFISTSFSSSSSSSSIRAPFSPLPSISQVLRFSTGRCPDFSNKDFVSRQRELSNLIFAQTFPPGHKFAPDIKTRIADVQAFFEDFQKSCNLFAFCTNFFKTN